MLRRSIWRVQNLNKPETGLFLRHGSRIWKLDASKDLASKQQSFQCQDHCQNEEDFDCNESSVEKFMGKKSMVMRTRVRPAKTAQVAMEH